MAKRGRKPALTEDQKERLRARRRSGVSYRDLQREYGVSASVVRNALVEGAPTPKKKQRKKTARKAAPSAPGETPSDLDELIADISAIVDDAKDSGDMTRLASATRLRMQAITLREKMRPPPEPEPADDPKYMAAAQQTIARLERCLDRAQKRRAEWPICDECGGHYRPADDPERDLSPAQRWAAAIVEAVA